VVVKSSADAVAADGHFTEPLREASADETISACE
jgi:hypothetical protein